MIIISTLCGFIGITFYIFLTLYEDAMYMVHLGSLQARIDIIPNIVSAYDLAPSILFTGAGPDSMIRVPLNGNEFLTLVKSSKYSVEGTVDSAIASYLLEFGIFFLFIFLFLMISGISRGLRGVPKHFGLNSYEGVYRYGGAYFLYVFICSTTQVLSLGKISYFVFFLLAVIFFGFRKTKLNNDNFTIQ